MSIIPTHTTSITTAVAALDAWFETIRGPDGYGGPVAHWWQQSFLYTGVGRDWRYEGIIAGYLLLWEYSSDPRWLWKAQRAGDDLLAGQLPNSHFAASAFEINPACAGTPHEAAVDVGLLLLAQALRNHSDQSWQRYAAAAEHNIRDFIVGQLWDEQGQYLRDSPTFAAFVPNKAATACEAFFLLTEITGSNSWVERYALPTLERIMAHQLRINGQLDGAIAQNSFGRRIIHKYFPLYIARCLPALLRGYTWNGDLRYIASALRAMAFIKRWTDDEGLVATVVYPDRRAIRTPAWVAALGDILRVAEMLQPYGWQGNFTAVEERILAGQTASGAFCTASGFAGQPGGKLPARPDIRDLLPVAGWCDKTFRYLAARAEPVLPPTTSERFEAECTFADQPLQFVETSEYLECSNRRGVCYRWRKGQPWAEIAEPAFWLR